MSSFSLQHRQLAGALEQAGLCPKASAQIAAILANSAQEMLHAGPLTHDSTPPQMRKVTPDLRRHVLPNLDFEEGDPDYVRPRIEPSEEEPPVEQPPTVVTTLAPQQADGVFGVRGGDYSDTKLAGNGVRVDVRAKVARKPPGGLPIAMIDERANRLVGKRLRAAVTEGGERLKAEIRENNEDVSLQLQFKNLQNYDVITGLEYVPGSGLRITTERVTAWSGTEKRTDWIPTTDAEVLTGIADDLHGFRAHAARIPVFEKDLVRKDSFYFNIFRVGTFTGGWERGTVKEVAQVWPADGRNVDVLNLTQDIPNTEETKYVLFAPRSQDRVTTGTDENGDPYPIDVHGEDEGAVPDVYPPVVENIAIEIQGESEDCVTFNYLLGKRAQDLTGYVSGQCQALMHNPDALSETAGCLQWGSATVNVISSVIYSPSGITFMQRPITVLCAGEETQHLMIPIEACQTTPSLCASTGCSYVWSNPGSESGEWLYNYECETADPIGCTCDSAPSAPPTGQEEYFVGQCVESAP